MVMNSKQKTPFLAAYEKGAFFLVFQGIPAGIFGGIAQFGFDAQQLVVLGNAVGAGGRAGLDLAHVQGHGQVGDGAVLGLAGAVGGNGPPAGPVAGLDGFDGLGQRADLVEFHQQGVGRLSP